ncbi:MAG: hypothetical protein L6Q71_03935, partial [Planctomycetes bacterium]|nr:hypothetical protein [Planctomycetota bacterium]
MLPQAIEFGSETNVWSYVAGAVILVVGGLLIWRMVAVSRINGWKYRGAAIGNAEIFNRLCEANGLSRAEVFLMRKMVFDQRMENPLLPFVDPG